MKGGKAFAQIHSDEPLLECRVLASAVGADEADAIARAMEKAGVTELVEGPRPKAAVAWLDGTREIGKVVRSMSLLDALQICEEAVDGLIGAIR
jgi:hypothetical protein